ncbi:MAG TPA: hypothetical protein DEB39_14065 [Planctomycetaceae bacterium]|nr:hypothetical protein [Planctomycetaceae bacterium]
MSKTFHVFLIHNPILYLIAKRVIEYKKLDPEDCLFLGGGGFSVTTAGAACANDLKHIGFRHIDTPTDWHTSHYFVDRSQVENTENIGKFDSYVANLFGNDEFHLYLPQSSLPYFSVFASHPRCGAFSYVEEGLLAIGLRGREIKGTIKGILSRCEYLGKDMYACDHPRFSSAYGITRQSFAFVPEPNKVIFRDFFDSLGTVDDDRFRDADAILILGNELRRSNANVDLYFSIMDQMVREFFLKNGYRKILLRTKNFRNEHSLRTNDFFRKNKLIKFQEIDDSFFMEEVLKSFDIPVFCTASSLGYYAAEMNRKVYAFFHLYSEKDAVVKNRKVLQIPFETLIDHPNVQLLDSLRSTRPAVPRSESVTPPPELKKSTGTELHIFNIHSHITYLVSQKIIEQKKFSSEDCLFLISREGYSIPDENRIKQTNYPFAPLLSAKEFRDDAKDVDCYINTVTNGKDFHFYCPHLRGQFTRYFITHPGCLGFSYIEEGMHSINPLVFSETINSIIRRTADGEKRYLGDSRLSRFGDYYFRFDNEKFECAYGIFEEAFPATEKKILFGKETFQNAFSPSCEKADAILIMASEPFQTRASLDAFKATLRELAHSHFLPKGFKTVAYRLKLTAYYRDEEEFYASFFREFPQIDWVQIPDECVVENLIMTYRVPVFTFISSIGYYAAKLGVETFSYFNIFEKFDANLRTTLNARNRSILTTIPLFENAGVNFLKCNFESKHEFSNKTIRKNEFFDNIFLKGAGMFTKILHTLTWPLRAALNGTTRILKRLARFVLRPFKPYVQRIVNVACAKHIQLLERSLADHRNLVQLIAKNQKTDDTLAKGVREIRTLVDGLVKTAQKDMLAKGVREIRTLVDGLAKTAQKDTLAALESLREELPKITERILAESPTSRQIDALNETIGNVFSEEIREMNARMGAFVSATNENTLDALRCLQGELPGIMERVVAKSPAVLRLDVLKENLASEHAEHRAAMEALKNELDVRVRDNERVVLKKLAELTGKLEAQHERELAARLEEMEKRYEIDKKASVEKAVAEKTRIQNDLHQLQDKNKLLQQDVTKQIRIKNQVVSQVASLQRQEADLRELFVARSRRHTSFPSEKMKVCYIADNRTRHNWGCRATSMALWELIQMRADLASTIEMPNFSAREDFGRYASYQKFFPDTKKSEKCDYVTMDVKKTVDVFLAMCEESSQCKEELDKIKQADAVVINGEGSFIAIKTRRDMFLYLSYIHLAKRLGKKVYLVNAMFSPCSGMPWEEDVLPVVVEGLQSCDLVTLRDPLSFQYVTDFAPEANARFIPDALFTWYDNIRSEKPSLRKNDAIARVLPEFSPEDFNFTEPYLCISGTSNQFSYDNPDVIAERYSRLVNRLKTLGLPILLTPTCRKDNFFKKVSMSTQTPMLPVSVPITTGGRILANARCFISGRFHPSILASLGGTPCVFMDSNSHKTFSLQKMLEYENPKEYHCALSDEDIEHIYFDVLKALDKGVAERERISCTVKRLAERAAILSRFIPECVDHDMRPFRTELEHPFEEKHQVFEGYSEKAA